ncbi:hypothetical protein LX32DRAFT_726218 [Colletotrichum zoysiae]|uniref:Carboxypeptidase regulatory-like domain-containing protein n=1 Tax=Colletotrichum zoysiae TaxID=1216348 RepID=A0AAD9M3P4_9PEZI|nr:hypothetical protein LX32DRAFT_726218 [Colletotrichum zoysiae]
MRLQTHTLTLVGLLSPVPVKAACSHNNCLRAFIRRSSDVAGFCSTIATASLPETYPPFISTACTGDVASRVTSACKCIASVTSATVTSTPTASTTLTSSSTTSPASSSVISSSTTSSASSPVISSSSTASQPACTPNIKLEGVSESGFNAKDAPFSVKISCTELDTKNVAVYANLEEAENYSVTPEGISFSGFSIGSVLLSVFALDVTGSPIIKSFQLVFGSISMPVSVVGADGNPVSGATVTVNATTYPGVGTFCTTDNTGRCTFDNLPPTTIGLVARAGDNSIAVNGLAASSGLVTLKLMPYVDPDADASFDVANGTTGWSGGTTTSVKVKRDTQLVVSTNGQPNLQSAAKSFPVHPFTKSAYIKYKFVTSEVPGGYFGTQYNDYYSITIRSNTGAFVTVTNSMNALGLGAFDAAGATDWYTLSLPVPSDTESVRYDVGVSNVADALYDSQVIVEKVGDLQCEKCGDCNTCPSDPMCQLSCTDPPIKSCSFYRNCAQAQLGCDSGEYPLAYGEKNCVKISSNVDKFSPAGVDWVWNTMHCLQLRMVPVLQPCTATCASFSAEAFASHTGCYLENGICSLPCLDLIYLFGSVGTDLFTKESLIQAIQVGGGCIDNIKETLKGCGGSVAQLVAIEVILALLGS